MNQSLLWQTLPPQQRDRLVASLSQILQQFLEAADKTNPARTR